MDVTHLMPIGIVPIITLFGCASERTEALWPEPRPLGRDLPTYRALAEPPLSARPPIEEPHGALSLEEVLRAALLQNPNLSSTAFEVRAAEARTLQAGLLPNPEIELELEDFGGLGEVRGVHASQSTLQRSQLIELGGKRAKRLRAAGLERDIAGWDYEAKRLDVLTEATKAFVDVLAAQERLSLVVPRIPGVVREVRKRLGDVVRSGEVLAVIDSRELADAKAGYLAEGERLTFAESTFAREKSLWEKKISAEQDYLSAKQVLTEARIELQAPKHKFQALGLSEASLKQARARPEGLLTRYEIVSPLAGTVIEKHITAGELLKDDAEAFVVADLSTVWVTLQVPPTALPLVKKGQRVVISAGQSIPEAAGTISYVSPVLLEDTRTAVTHVELPNHDGHWRPAGLFVTATIVAGENQASVLLPKSAIQTIEGKPSVFVQTEEGFEARPVTLGPSNDAHVEITKGLSSGERYAATETFILKAELAKGEASHQH